MSSARTNGLLVVMAGFGLLTAACGEEAGSVGRMSDPAMMPAIAPGMAVLAGRVLSPDLKPIAGASVSIATVERNPGAPVVTGADGSFMLTVPGNTSLVARAELANYARGLGAGVIVPAGTMSTGYELFMLPSNLMGELNTLGGSKVMEYGAFAVDVHSMSGACDITGGTISIEPAVFGKVFYTKSGDPAPDATATGIASTTGPAAWVVGVLPPAIYFRLGFHKAGCSSMAMPLEFQGRSHTGNLVIETGAVSHTTLFVQ